MKKAIRILSFILVFALTIMPLMSFAITRPSIQPADPGSAIDSNLTGTVSTVLGIIQWVGYAVALVVVLTLGVQWMLATPAKKAELKGKMWSVGIGILLLVGGVTILDWVWTMAEKSAGSTTP